MDGRIGSLEVRYHTPGLDPTLAARLPALTRALELQLADALDADLTAAIGDGRDVYVVRELSVRTALDDGWMLDRPVVERMSRASVEAVSAALARPSDDVKHFADQAEFLCAFIVDELDGAAADRWYFGAFAPYRRADAGATIEAVLAAHPAHVAATIGRLARHGRLDALLAALGAGCLLDLLGTATGTPSTTGVAVLVDAALQLAGLAGWPIDGSQRLTLRRALLARHADAAPAWGDRRIVSAFVWACVEDAAEMLRARGVTPTAGDRGGLVRVLHGDLDWLDTSWLLERLDEGGAEAGSATPASPNRLTFVLTRIAAAVAEGRVPFPASDADDVLLIRLVAAAQLRAEEGVAFDALHTVLTAAVGQWRRLVATPLSIPDEDRRASGERPPTSATRREHRGRARDAHTPDAAAKALAQALAEQSAAVAGDGEPTRGASLYLLSRVVLDAGLPGLATAHGVPLPPLLAQLAVRWLQLEWPLDQPAHDWTGAATHDDLAFDGLEPVPGLAALAAALRDRLMAQRALTTVTGGDMVPLPRDASTMLDAIAAWLLRAWARWLPGLHQASAGFLQARCLARGGAVRRSESRIDVMLDPAPLDVVLQMAGYLRPIETLPWCGGLAVSFAIRRQPSA